MSFRSCCALALLAVAAAAFAAQALPDASQQPANTTAPVTSNTTTGIGSPAVTNSPSPSSPNATSAPAANAPSTGAATTAAPVGTSAASVERNDSTSSATAGTTKTARASDRDPLLDLPALPKAKVALQGGTLIQVDPVRDRLVMRPFQGKKEEIAFDVRTQFTRDGKNITVRDLKPGTAIYADTIWDGQHVFAKAVRTFTSTYQDQEHGQILAYDPGNGSLRVRDELFPDSVELKVSKDTVIRKAQSPGSAADLRPGALVAIKFQPGSRGQVYQVDVLATPGSEFVFSGPITHIDLLAHVLGISNRADSIIYDIHFDPARVKVTSQWQEGADVDVNAMFDGTKYFANSIAIRGAQTSP